MKEVEYKGLNEKVYVHEHSSGLKTYMWVNEKVNGCYMTLTVRYGSLHTEFKVGTKKYKVPNGIAHFLEHIKFNESEDFTAHDFFLKSGGDANAFTTFGYTSYIVFTSVNLKDNLNHLIDYVYNPYFTKKIVQKEKGIIIEEANMGLDDPYSVSFFELLKNLFYQAKYKEYITGTPEEVKEITLEDIENVYNSFYHPENMFLCITGNFNPYEMAKVIDENLDQKEFTEFIKPVIIKKKEPKEVVRDYEELELNVMSPRVKYALKLSKSKFKDIDDFSLRCIINLVLSINFGNTSDLKEELLSKGLVTSFGANTEFYDDYAVSTINADTEYPEEIIKRIEDQIDNLIINEKDFLRKQKVNLATLILTFDDIESVNMQLMDNLIRYDDLLPDMMERYKAITYDNFKDVASKIDKQNKSVLVIKPPKKD